MPRIVPPVAIASPPPPPWAAVPGAATCLPPLVFLDLEASSLAADSWPVEVGLAWIDAAGAVRCWDTLIAPRAGWAQTAWSEAAARVHGISTEAVRAGTPADAVAAALDRLAGCEMVSDNPRWDQRWLDRLRAGRGPRLTVSGLRDVVGRRLDDRAAATLALALFRDAATHRAGPDAARLARAWAAAARPKRAA